VSTPTIHAREGFRHAPDHRRETRPCGHAGPGVGRLTGRFRFRLGIDRPGPPVGLYAALAAGWVGLAGGVAPRVIAAAYGGRSLPALNRFFVGRAPHSLDHYLGLWRAFSGAVLIAGGLHLALALALARSGRRDGRSLLGFSVAFLALTVLSGPRHDYVADLEIWDAVLRGLDPWWIAPGRDGPLNAYGPLFNALAALCRVNPMAPKLLFATAYLVFLIRLLDPGRWAGSGPPRFARVAWFFNPFPWVEVAYFGHFDVLVAVACVAAVDRRIRGRDASAGVWLGAGVLLKYLPLAILPFLALDGRRPRPRLMLAAGATVAAGLAVSALIWGPATFRPLTFAATRGSTLLSIFRFLRGPYSPLVVLGLARDVDFLALPCLAAAGLAAFAWCLRRRADPATSALAAALTTLLFYRVGFVQYQMVPFLLASYWALSPARPARAGGFVAAAMGAYFGWLALFDVYYASFGGVVHPGDPRAWVDDVAGLPTFLLGSALLVGLLRAAGGPPRGVPAGRGGSP